MAGKGTATRRCGAKKVFVKSTKVTYKYATQVRASRSGAAQPKSWSIKRPVVARKKRLPQGPSCNMPIATPNKSIWSNVEILEQVYGTLKYWYRHGFAGNRDMVKLIHDTILRMHYDPVFHRMILEFITRQAAIRSSRFHTHSEFGLDLQNDAGILNYSVYLQDQFHSFNRH